MADSTELEARVAAMEQAVATVPARWPLTVAVGLMLIAVGLLAYQSTLLQRQLESMRANDRQQLFWTLCIPTTPVAERTNAFTRLVAAGHTEWRSAITQGLQLKGSHLDHADLRAADLTACDLRDATLFQTDLTGARLRTADLSGADLTEATLDGAECLRATADDANFHKVEFRSGSLEQVSARNAKFVMADMSETYFLMADLTGADFTGANLTGSLLESARLRGATLALTNLAQANLKNADLTNSNWWRARGLSRSQLEDFAIKYPPTDAADPSRVKDYLLWADGFGKPDDKAANRPRE